ncbi:WD40 repeat domain-containing serine/threonine protein kinase [Thermostilla marina]
MEPVFSLFLGPIAHVPQDTHFPKFDPSGTSPDEVFEERFQAACAALERRIAAGNPARAETFIEELGPARLTSEQVLELIYTEYAARCRAGEKPDLDEYFERFPDRGNDLEELFFVHEAVHSQADTLPWGLAGTDDAFDETDIEHDAADRDPDSETEFEEAEGETLRRRLAHYELLDILGQGASGVVYRAKDLKLNRIVALKVIRTGPDLDRSIRRKFRREVEAAARLRHPNIVQVFEIAETDQCQLVAMELVEGGSLADRQDAAWEPRRAAELILQLTEAIAYAHHRWVLHRDLKPANVLLEKNGTPKLADFSLAKMLDDDSTATRGEELIGTPCYMAPEQAGGRPWEIGPRADIYALGAILYELLVGRPPFRGRSTIDTLVQVRTADPISPSRLRADLPRDLVTICLKCLEKDPDDRYMTAEELAEDLRRFLQGRVILARPAPWWEHVWKWAKRHRDAVIASAVLLLVAAVISGGMWWYRERFVSASRASERWEQVARSQAEEIVSQRDRSRQQAYAETLAHVRELMAQNPAQALVILDDPEKCPTDLRDAAWQILRTMCTAGRTTIGSQASKDRWIRRIALSKDGRRLACGTWSGDIAIWDMESRAEVSNLYGHTDWIACLAFSPDGRHLASAAYDQTLRIWDAVTGEQESQAFIESGVAWCVEFSRDGGVLVAGTDYGLRVWDVPGGFEMPSLEVKPGVRSAAFSPDGSRLALGLGNGEIHIVSWPDLAPLETWREFRAPILSVAFSPDGDTLAAVGARHLLLYDFENAEKRYIREAHLFPVRSVGFSSDGTKVITSGEDFAARIWDVETLSPVRELTAHLGHAVSAVFAPDDHTVYTVSEGILSIWDLNAPEIPDTLGGTTLPVNAAQFLPGTNRLVTVEGGPPDSLLSLWNLNNGKRLARTESGQTQARRFAILPDGSQFVCIERNGQLVLRNARTLEAVKTLKGLPGGPASLVVSHDGHYLYSGHRNGSLFRYDFATSTAESIEAISGEQGAPVMLSLSPVDARLAVGTDLGYIQLWDTNEWKLVSQTRLQTRAPADMVFSPDGEYLAAVSTALPAIFLYDARSLELIRQFDETPCFITSLTFSPDGRTLVSGSPPPSPTGRSEVRLWNVASGRCHAVFEGFGAPVAFSPDGRYLIARDIDKRLRIWKLSP